MKTEEGLPSTESTELRRQEMEFYEAAHGGSTEMANITRLDPLAEIVSLRSAMDRLFDDSFVNPSGWRTVIDGYAIAPPLDVQETSDEIVVTAALPGMKADDVDITITGQTLTIQGEFRASDSAEGAHFLHQERRFGTFSRTLQLPVRVQGEAARAAFSEGVLTLHIPKAEEVKPRQIRINADATPASDNGKAS